MSPNLHDTCVHAFMCSCAWVHTRACVCVHHVNRYNVIQTHKHTHSVHSEQTVHLNWFPFHPPHSPISSSLLFNSPYLSFLPHLCNLCQTRFTSVSLTSRISLDFMDLTLSSYYHHLIKEAYFQKIIWFVHVLLWRSAFSAHMYAHHEWGCEQPCGW